MSKPSSSIGKYLRGVDFSNYKVENFDTARLGNLQNLHWLKLNHGKFKEIPEISQLKNLECVTMMRNEFENMEETFSQMASIKVLNLRNNKLTNDEKFMTHFNLGHLMILDLSSNRLTEICFSLHPCKSLMVLNLSRNKISRIPEDMFACTAIKHLDLSENLLENLSQSIFQLRNLENLNISENPLISLPKNDGKSLFSHMKVLKASKLQIQDVEAAFDNFLPQCPVLIELDAGVNNLKHVPKSIFKCAKLERLVLNSNLIEKIPNSIGVLKRLKYLSLSFNKITEIPSTIGKLKNLKRFYANGNQIASSGIPESMSSLLALEILHLASNKLETFSANIACCFNLRSLNLRNNELRTIPPLRDRMKNLQDLDTRGNPNLVIIRRPPSKDPLARYNFTYDNVRNFVVAYLKYKQKINQEKVLAEKAALEIAKKQNKINRAKKLGNKIEKIHNLTTQQKMADSVPLPPPPPPGSSITTIAAKKPNDVRRNILGIPILDDQDEPDISDMFPEEVGENPGLFIMSIQNLLPVPLPEDQIGTFYSEDCYLILYSSEDRSSLDHKVFIWIGKNTSIEKKTCVAVHSITLRGYVGSSNSIIRIEDDSENEKFTENSDTFKSLSQLMPALKGKYEVLNGSINPEKERKVKTVKTTFYRLILNESKQVRANLWPFLPTWLDDRYSYMLDHDENLYLYNGRKVGVSLKVKARLFVEKVKSVDQSDHAEIIDVNMENEESIEFWKLLGSKPTDIISNPAFDKNNEFKPILYKVVVGQGFIELPQVDQPEGNLCRDLLNESCAFVLDTYWEVYNWYGRKVNVPMRRASDHLAQEVLDFVNRPSSAAVISFRQDFESMAFKSNFVGWTDMLPGNYSKKPTSNVSQPASDSKASKGPLVVSSTTFNLPDMEVSALFLPKSVIPVNTSNQLLQDAQEDLDSMESFVMDRQGTLIPLSEQEVGHFFTNSSYIFICAYSETVNDDEESSEEEDGEEDEDDDEDNNKVKEVTTIKKFYLYFWEGIKSPKASWLNYSFKYQKMLQQKFKNKLHVVRIQQDMEPMEFKALFSNGFVIHSGARPTEKVQAPRDRIPLCKIENSKHRMYQVRSYDRRILSACIEISPLIEFFSPDTCNFVVAPLDSDSSSHESADADTADVCIVYLWIGCQSSDLDKSISQDYLQRLGEAYGCKNNQVIMKQTEETEKFRSLFSKQDFCIPTSEVSILKWTRLFSFGFHAERLVVEEIFPFCPMHLRENTVSLVDSGAKLYVYMSENVNQRVRHFLLKLLPIYQEQQKKKNYGAGERKVVIVKPQKEPSEFKRLFHGWFLDI